jgi:hexokinase
VGDAPADPERDAAVERMRATEGSETAEPLTTAEVFRCVLDRSEKLDAVARVLDALGAASSSLQDRITTRRVCQLVVRRAARFTAVGIAAILAKISYVRSPVRAPHSPLPSTASTASTSLSSPGPAPVWTVAVEGSVFAKNLDFDSGRPDAEPHLAGIDRWIREALRELDQDCNLVVTRDATVLGTAILAAALDDPSSA